jgi:hypothetical protein
VTYLYNAMFVFANLLRNGFVENYASAAIRHFEDAEAFKVSGKLDNAGHLIGFAAECAIKHKISSLRPGQDSPHGHFPDILIVARKHLGQRSNYTSMFDILKTDIFSGWHVNRRYYLTGTTSQAELDDWFSVARRLLATAELKARR